MADLAFSVFCKFLVENLVSVYVKRIEVLLNSFCMINAALAMFSHI